MDTRSRLQHTFADQKSQMRLFIRTFGITRATMKIGLATIIYTMRRFIFLEQISATV
ncbi:transposase [Acetobacter indonesiensis]|uniref:Transposase n=1 Tax=Acetobacter indonesiensis TaxID=104101 RepID=A0A252AL43_9PROT|nr:transposase [Acetobacter indonesiensis]OUI94003.1 transposase [Acetobacter indonesiensis]